MGFLNPCTGRTSWVGLVMRGAVVTSDVGTQRASKVGTLKFGEPDTLPPAKAAAGQSGKHKEGTQMGDIEFPSRNRTKVLVIAGPTGVGKTALALALARKLGGEIVSADSVQVYTGLDVGSAKTPFKDRQGIPHHLVDIVYPTEDYTAGCFHDNAREATAKVVEQDRVPIVVGGTGMYLNWYMDGKAAAPKSCPEAAAAVEVELSKLVHSGGGWDQALKLLADAGDKQTPLALERNDWYRLRRALEIVRFTGRPRTDFPLLDPSLQDGSQADYHFLCYFLYKPRIDLYRQIDLRCEEMVARPEGLLQEASWLLDLGGTPNSSSASRAIGYRQAMEYLVGRRRRGGISTEEEFLNFLSSFQKASRNYARRQLTWFRGESRFRWVDASQALDNQVRVLTNDFQGLPCQPETQIMAGSYKEGQELKRYRTQLQIFHDPTAMARIIDWIRMTQGGDPKYGLTTTSL